ncbi:type II secretion system protein GspM [Bosea sp. 2KB_26]|uniref:type II secretion system protein GspM n=1 Tax=Bosea sp. 2KB_26 TaxID=3237475 RepID=UPI003F915BEF
MWRQIKSWTRFIAFVAANGLILAGIYLFMIDPALQILRDQETQITQNAVMIEHLGSAVARRQSLSALRPEDVDGARRRFLQGDTESLSTADLLTRLREVADQHAVSFNSVATLPARNWSGHRMIGARVEFTAATPRIAEVLSSLEDGSSFFFIRNAKLTAPSEAEAIDNKLGVTIEIYGVTRWSKG